MTSNASTRFRRILCPVDFSSDSRHALGHAAELAERNGGKFFVLFVNDPLLDAAAAAAAYDTEVLKARTMTELARFVKRAGLRPADGLLTVNGHPAPAIKRVAERLKADLIVMGSRGLTGAAKTFFGSTTERTLRIAQVPVMVVPRTIRRRKDGQSLLSGLGKTALIPIDLADYKIADVRKVLNVARQMGANPLFIHAVPPVRLPAWLRLTSSGPDNGRFDAAWRAIKRAAGAGARGVECRLVFGDPADQVAAAAVGSGIGLIVLSLKHSRSLLGPRRGSISYRLIAKEVATVLAVPERRRSG